MGLKNAGNFSLDQANGLLSVVTSTVDCTTNFQAMDNYQVGTIYSSTADTTVASTNAETTLIGTGVGTLVLPNNFLVIGKTIRFRCEGYIANILTPTIRLKIKLNSTVIIDTGAQTTSTITGTRKFIYEGSFTCRSASSTGTVIGQGEFRYFTAAIALAGIDAVSTSTVTIDTTASLTLDVTVTWGTSSASNTITATNTIFEVLA